MRAMFLNVILILSITLWPFGSGLGIGQSSIGRDLSCPSDDGAFPAVDSCHSFYVCLGGRSTRIDCPHFVRTQVFSPARKTCVKFIPPINKCHKFQCQNSLNYGAYTGDQTLYAVCRFGTPLTVLQCPDGSYFDQNTQSCVISCSQEGLVADPSDCTKFFECRRFLGRYQSALRSCPLGTWFDPAIKACSLDGIENCKLVPTTSTTTEEPSTPSTENTPGSVPTLPTATPTENTPGSVPTLPTAATPTENTPGSVPTLPTTSPTIPPPGWITDPPL